MVLPEEHPPCDICTGNNPAIAKIAREHHFTYEEALAYVIVIGVAHANRPAEPATTSEPGE